MKKAMFQSEKKNKKPSNFSAPKTKIPGALWHWWHWPQGRGVCFCVEMVNPGSWGDSFGDDFAKNPQMLGYKPGTWYNSGNWYITTGDF